MLFLALLVLSQQPLGEQTTTPLQTLEEHARRGAVVARLDGIAAESAPACETACRLDERCQAWTWNTGWVGRAPRCDIHAIALTPRPQAGAVTGLAPQLTRRINAAIDREPTRRELRALDEAGGSSVTGEDGLAGG